MNAYATPPGSDGDGSLPPSPSVVMSGYGGPHEEGGGAGQEPVYKFEGPIPQSYFDLSEEDIATIPYRDLVKLMSKSGLTDREVEVAKKLRRKVKNRLSARVCTGRKRVYEARSSNDTATLVRVPPRFGSDELFGSHLCFLRTSAYRACHTSCRGAPLPPSYQRDPALSASQEARACASRRARSGETDSSVRSAWSAAGVWAELIYFTS
jgi:hypothetical protein